MRLLILSDSHNHLYYARKVIEKLKDRIDLVIHLGDHDKDALVLNSEFPEINLDYVKGNCDFDSSSPSEKMIHLSGKKILMLHGHNHHVKWGYDRIAYYGQKKEADILLFGHTHVPFMDYYGKMLLLNPGSISLPRATSIPTFGIINFEKEGKVEVAIMTVNKNASIDRLRSF